MNSSKPKVTPRVKIDPVIANQRDSEISKEIDSYIKSLRSNHFVDERGIWQQKGQGAESLIRCSKEMIDWSADKFKDILSALKANGCEIEFKSTERRRYEDPVLQVVVKLERAWERLRIDEATTRRERPLTASERKEKEHKDATGGWFYYRNQWLYTPTGKPKLVVGYYKRRTIGDDIQPLVNNILSELKDDNNSKIRREIEERHTRAKLLMRIRKFRHTLWEEQQFEVIEKESKKWARAQKLRAYIEQVNEVGEVSEVAKWVTMANQLVNALDPISSGSFAAFVKLPKYSVVKEVWNQRQRQHY